MRIFWDHVLFSPDKIKTEKQKSTVHFDQSNISQKQIKADISQWKCNPLIPKEGHHRMKTLIETTNRDNFQ